MKEGFLSASWVTGTLTCLINTKVYAVAWLALFPMAVLFPSGAAAWNARDFQHGETDFRQDTKSRTPSSRKNWEEYYYPFYQLPSSFVPSSFMSPTLDDCHRVCELNPSPFKHAGDCKRVCNTRKKPGCKRTKKRKCLDNSGLPSIVVPVFKGHNWIIHIIIF